MHPRLFRLHEKLQRVDELLRAAQRQHADRTETDRLRHLKYKAKRLIHKHSLNAVSA